jgi:hypothetical protein
MQTVFPVDSSGNLINPTPQSSGNNGTILVDEAESLVFWLSYTDKNPQYPFLKLKAIRNKLTTINSAKASSLPIEDPKIFYDFDQARLGQTPSTVAGLDVPSFIAKYCSDSFYIYIDSRAYDNPRTDPWDVCRFASNDGSPPGDTYAYADDSQTGVRPYWSNVVSPRIPTSTTPPVLTVRDKFKPVNPTTFQIICAGQDGDFGTVIGGDADAKVAYGSPSATPGIGTNFTTGDKDNITNFSNGKMLGDLIP